MRAAFTILVAAAMAFPGCIDPTDSDRAAARAPAKGITSVLPQVLPLVVDDRMNFTDAVVSAAVGFTNDLYEPTMDVSDAGVIYVTGHTMLVDTTGAPVFMSKDGGKTWSQLPFAGNVKMPGSLHGATPPPTDEIFLAAGEDGWLYGVDITVATFPVNAWKGDGAEHAYHNPNAYDRVESTTSVCGAAGVNDRPWSAYAKGKLLMVNNPGGGNAPLGRVEVGVMDVPPAVPVGLGAPVLGAKWNYCATSGGFIPGIPDMRDDHLFAVPQVKEGSLNVVVGNAKDVMKVDVIEVFRNKNDDGRLATTTNGGHAAFDQDGTLFLGLRNNTQPDAKGIRQGRLHLAASQDDGKTFVERTIALTSAATSFYMDGNMAGPGALITWAQVGEPRTDWYAAHVFLGPDGGPVVENVTRVIKAGPPPSAHVQGAAVGPDGRAYFVTYHGDYRPTDQATPLHVWVQNDGPTMPVLPKVARGATS